MDNLRLRFQTLECDRSWCQCHRTTLTGRGLTHCPAHGPDRHPSLSVTTSSGGVILVHCFTGCDQLHLWESLFGKEFRQVLGLPPRTHRNTLPRPSHAVVIPQ